MECYDDGDVIETPEGNLVCRDGVFEGPNVDSPLPNDDPTRPVLS